MEIAVITYCLGYNYGAMLQSYATVKTLENLGHNIRLINYHQPWSFGLDPRDWHNYIGRDIHSTVSKWRALYSQLLLYRRFRPMWRLFPFTESYGSDYQKLLKMPPDCDCLISGSDQVWNTTCEKESYSSYFLPFGSNSVKRLSYASSLGGEKFDRNNLGWIVAQLKRYTKISVREVEDVEYIKSLGIRDVHWMPDPTFLLDKKSYLNLTQNEPHSKHDAFVYILGQSNKSNHIITERIIDLLALDKRKILNVALHNFKIKGAVNKIVSVPRWLDGLVNARLVITNSFHAVVFSLIFNKPFVYLAFDDDKKNKRVRSILRTERLKSRILYKESAIGLDLLNFRPDCQSLLDNFQSTGLKFLNENLD